jgi:monoamine oxidase
MRVCVIGAGFAGLLAAATLAERGIEPLVVEARRRVGGRVLSQQLANDAVAERGADFAEPAHQTMAEVAGQLGLTMVPMGMRAGVREPRGSGVDTTPDAVLAEVAKLERLVAERRGQLAGRSAAQVLAELRWTPARARRSPPSSRWPGRARWSSSPPASWSTSARPSPTTRACA